MTKIEVVEADKLMARIQELQKKVDGVKSINTFIKHRLQPRYARDHTMWMYSCPSHSRRISKEDFSVRELKRSIKVITRLRDEDPLPGEPEVLPFGDGNGIPNVIFDFKLFSRFLSNLL
jgi:hypothetical protein